MHKTTYVNFAFIYHVAFNNETPQTLKQGPGFYSPPHKLNVAFFSSNNNNLLYFSESPVVLQFFSVRVPRGVVM